MAQPIKVPKYSDAVQRKGFIKGPAGISLEQAKADMLAAQEVAHTTAGGDKVPAHIAKAQATRGQGGNSPKVDYTPQEIADANESLQSGAQSSLPATPATPPTPARVAASPAPATVEPAAKESAPQPAISHRFASEESEFFYETYRDNRDGKWYGIVDFKLDANGNQPGAEKFVADNQSELILKILKGKGHSTAKIRTLAQVIKKGGRPDLSEYFAAELQKAHGFTVEEFNALPEKTRATLTDRMYADEIYAFKDLRPEYQLSTPEGKQNLEAVVNYLRKQNWPITRRNLQMGYTDLELAQQIIPVAPAITTPSASVTSTAPAAPRRIRGQFTTGLVPGASSGNWAGGSDDDAVRAQEASARKNAGTGGLTPEQRIKELSKTAEGMAQVKKEMRAGFKPQAPSYRG